MLDFDPTQGTSFGSIFDPINTPYADHSLGTNADDDSTDIVSADALDYAFDISILNVAQNSWKAHWFLGPGFDPTADATYDIALAAYDGGAEIAKTSIQIVVGAGGAAVPDEGSSAVLMGIALVGFMALRRRNQA